MWEKNKESERDTRDAHKIWRLGKNNKHSGKNKVTVDYQAQ